jgi:peptide/nickel transport system permease protein
MSAGHRALVARRSRRRRCGAGARVLRAGRHRRSSRAAVIVALALFAPLLAPQNPYDLAKVTVMDARLEPGETSSAGFRMWLGADGAGRDMWSAMLYGLRISLASASPPAWSRSPSARDRPARRLSRRLDRRADHAPGRPAALFPAILVALILVAILGQRRRQGDDRADPGAVGLLRAHGARLGAGRAPQGYIEAAHCLDLPPRRIVFRHLLPNVIAPMIVVATLQTAHAISLEATLSFLGVGLPQTEPSLGLLISNGFEYMLSGKHWISFFPGFALLATIMSINLVGDRCATC